MDESNICRSLNDHKQLLINIKDTLETIFHSNLNNDISNNSILDISNALPKLHLAVEKIFIHGIRIYRNDGTPNVWCFIEGLNWLSPAISVSTSVDVVDALENTNIPFNRIKNDKALLWIYDNLKNMTLSHKLEWLISDHEHLSNCYDASAFLRNEKYSNAFILCLQAIEKNQRSILSQIEINLYDKPTHKRSTSHPDFRLSNTSRATNKVTNNNLNKTTPEEINAEKTSKRNLLNKKGIVNLKLRPWSSLPNINVNLLQIRTRSKTISSQPISILREKVLNGNVRLTAEVLESINKSDNMKKVPSFSYKQFPCGSVESQNSEMQKNSKIDELQPISLVKCDDIEIHVDRKYSRMNQTQITSPSSSVQSPNYYSNKKDKSKLSFKNIFLPFFDSDEYEIGESSTNSKSFFSRSAPTDFVNTFIPQYGMKLSPNTSANPILDEKGNLSLPESTGHGYFPRPIQGQSLASFLQVAQFSRTNTELERENAHFSLAEAMISAMEQLKWKEFEKKKLKRNLCNGNVKEKKKRKNVKIKTWDADDEMLNNHKKRFERQPSQKSNESDSDTSWNFSDASSTTSDEESIKDTGNLSYLKAVSVSTHSVDDLVAYAEWGDNNRDALSAEGVALSLISKFSDKQLPRASDLLWLVSEQDAPQRLLPMPGSWSVNPDEKYYTFLRGTRDWAPPRAQIIFTKHPTPLRKKILQNQNQRCAGCGMRVAQAFSHRYRYCDYLGKYFCTGCHRNQISIIPARVINDWEFNMRPVSVFSYRLLNQIWAHPLFRLNDLNPKLFLNNKTLRIARDIRCQLKFIKDFITTCRFSVDNVKELFESIPNHITDDIEIWSMTDLVAAKKGLFTKNLKEIIFKCEEHIFKCELCMARGFLCELCPKKQIIFPWQQKVKRCNMCGTCYHDTCWKNECAKCLRLQKRNI